MPISRTPAQTGSRLAFLDGLRLVAALMVVLYHYTAFAGVKGVWDVPSSAYAFPGLSRLTSYGWLGVELFFLISGFVICMSSWGRDTGAFARSRIVRLFPAYWAAVLITATVTTIWAAPRPLTVSWSDLLVNLTMMQRPLGAEAVEGVYWTLWAEARFYLLFALLIWWGLSARRVMIFGYAWLIASAYTMVAKVPLLTEIFMPNYAPFFVGGIAFFLIHRFGSDLRFWGLAGLSWLIAQQKTYAMVNTVSDGLPRPISPAVGVLLVSLFYVLMAGVALGWFSRIGWRWLTTAGVLTYPLYLLHEKIGWVIIHQMRDVRPRYVTLGVTVAAMLVASWLLHRLVERPVARYLKAGLAKPTPGGEQSDRAGRRRLPHPVPHLHPRPAHAEPDQPVRT